MAENQRAASAIGLSPDWIAAANWALGSAVAGVATILIGGGRVYAEVLAVAVLLTLWGIMSVPIRALPRAGETPQVGPGRVA